MNALDVLKEVKRRIIADPKIWSRGLGSADGPWCVLQHMDRVAGRDSVLWSRSRNAFHAVACVACGGNQSVGSWNDDPKRTAWDVIAMLGKAIRSLEATP